MKGRIGDFCVPDERSLYGLRDSRESEPYTTTKTDFTQGGFGSLERFRVSVKSKVEVIL